MQRVNPPDMSWLGPARAGDRDALGAAIEACRAALVTWIAGQSAPRGDVGDPEQVVGEGCRRALECFEQFRGGSWGEWYNWLRAICDHRLADERRKRGRAPRLHNFAALTSGLSGGNLGIAAAGPGASSEANRRELIATIKKAIGELPKAERVALWLHYIDDLGLEEIAALLGKSYDAVRMAKDRGVSRLKLRLGATAYESH